MIVITLTIVALNTGSNAQRNTKYDIYTKLRTLIGFECRTHAETSVRVRENSEFYPLSQHFNLHLCVCVPVCKSSGNSVINSHNEHTTKLKILPTLKTKCINLIKFSYYSSQF